MMLTLFVLLVLYEWIVGRRIVSLSIWVVGVLRSRRNKKKV